MGELSNHYADIKRENYIDSLRRMKQAVRENFDDMDFENANKRNEVENIMISIEDSIQRRISTLNSMRFG